MFNLCGLFNKHIDDGMIMKCPYCNSIKTWKHGKTSKNRQRYICKKCNKTYVKNSRINYPHTKIPFEFIAYILYSEELNKKRKVKYIYRKNDKKVKNNQTVRVKKFLSFLDLPYKKVSKTTIYLWNEKYGSIYKKLVTPEEAVHFYRSNINKEKISVESLSVKEPFRPIEEFPKKTHLEELSIMVMLLGVSEARKFIRMLEEINMQKEYFKINPWLIGTKRI